MTRIGRFVAAAWLALGGMAHADPVVVELFTSQGCSSCPPADKVLGELAEDDDVIALAFHVDYWDYLGWKDEFASAEHTKRQRAYARAKGERTIYTPQIVVGGVDHAVGSRGMKVAQLVRKHAATDLPVSVRLRRQGGTLVIRADAARSVPDMVVQIVTFSPRETVNIRRGENAGRKLTYHNVVRSFRRAGTWNGQGNFSAQTEVGGGPVAVLFQAGRGGAILGAAQLR